MATLGERFSNLCKTALWLALMGLVVVGGYMYFAFDEGIRSHVETLLRKHYSGLDVRVRSARWIRGEGIEVRGISISERSADGPQAVLVHVEELVLLGVKDLKQLISSPRFERMIVRRPTIRATRQQDGRWTTSQLLPLPKFSRQPCAATIEDGRLLIVDLAAGSPGAIELRQMHLAISPKLQPEGRTGERCLFEIQGQLVSDHFRRAQFKGTFDLSGSQWTAAGSVAALELSPELQTALPLPPHELADELAAIQGVADFNFSVSKTPNAPAAFQVTGLVRQGRIEHPKLPYPLADVEARLRIDNTGLAIDELRARNGPTTLWLSARTRGLAAGCPLTVEARVRQMVLDQRLQRALPGHWRDAWYKFLPAGEVDADFNLTYDGATWTPRARVYCRDVAFTYHKFPYRLERAAGTLELVGSKLTIYDLKATNGAEFVRIEARIDNPGPQFTGELIVKGDGQQVNDKLLLALVERQRRVAQALHPSGTFDVFVHVRRQKVGDPVERTIRLDLRRCSMRFDGFPYPVDNIRGSVIVRGNEWEFRQFEGTNDNGLLSGSGYLRPTYAGNELYLELQGQNIPLEAELREALKPGMRRLWSDLKPYGSVNLKSCQIRVLTAQERASVAATIEPVGETVSIEPASFPYRLEKLKGLIHYRDGQVSWERMTCEHDRVAVAAKGRCDLLPAGGWRLQLDDLAVDRLHVDDDLLPALPPRMRRGFEQLEWSGPLNIHGGHVVLVGGQPSKPLEAQWQMTLDTHGGSLRCGVPLENVHGSVVLTGNLDQQGLRCSGDVRLDAVSYRDVQFSSIRGPMYFDDDSLRLGAWAVSPAPNQTVPRLTALVDGGSLAMDCWITMTDPARYTVRASLTAAELAQVMRDVGKPGQDLRGKASAEIELQGTSAGRRTLTGGGQIHLREADIYELPVMVALLKIVSASPPDTTAFSKSDVKFRIRDDHVYFDEIHFNGDAISLRGNGQMSLDREIELTFHAMVGRDEMRVPILDELMGEASQQILQIHVGGTMDNPTTYREAFPGVSQALESLGGGDTLRR